MKARNVNLVPSVLVVRVYKGHDFPQMDPRLSRSKTKQYVDPYCIVSFAGQKPIKTATRENDYDPVWNQEMRFQTFVSLETCVHKPKYCL